MKTCLRSSWYWVKPALAQWDENKLKIAIKLINTVFERRANLKSLNGKRLKFDSLNPVEQCHGGRRFAGFEGRGPEREKWEMKIWILTNCSTYSSGRPSWPFWPETISVGADRVLCRLLNRNKTLTWMCCEIGLKILRKHIVKILNYGQKGPSSLAFPTIRKTSPADFRIHSEGCEWRENCVSLSRARVSCRAENLKNKSYWVRLLISREKTSGRSPCR